MEKIIVAVRGSRSGNEPLASASKCLGSLVQINSIAIDINCAMEMEEIEAPKHEHFSIRGFVSDMRKKDRRMCLPFPPESNDDAIDIDPPPLSVPKFRWWQCSECVPDTSDPRSTLGMILADQSDVAGTSSNQNANHGEKDGLLVQNIGDVHGSRDSNNVDYNDQSDKLIEFNLRCTEEHKSGTNVRSNEVETSRIHITEASPVHISETCNNTADPSTRVNETENAPSGSDENIAFNALPHRRKPKLRSLADIINEGKNLASENPITKSSQIEADLIPQPQFEVSSDVTRLTKTPQRKRKNIVLEEDIGPLETNPPTITAKRTKGTATEAENNNNNNNTCKQVEVSESDKERDRPTRLDIRVSAKNHPNKPRKQKALDISRKMMVSNVHSANLQKHPVTAGDSFSNTGHVGLFFKNSLYRQEWDIISDVSKGKRHEEGDYSPYIPNNIQEKVALDLSLSSYMCAGINIDSQESSRKNTGIPDLNESFVEKTYMTEVEQVPTFSETRDFTLRGNLDMSASSSVLSKPPQAFRNMDNIKKKNNNNNNNYNTAVESGVPSDDIPMEIVELLAKNQHERALDNSRNPCKRSPYYIQSTPGTINFPYTNARSSLNVPSGNMGVGQGYFNLPQSRNCRSDIAILDKSQFRQFSPLSPSQQSVALYSGPNSISGPRPCEGADLLWPPRRKGITFDLTGIQNGSVQANGFEDRSFKGKEVGYMKGEGRRCVNDEPLVKEGRLGPGRKSVGSVDAYTNDTIPAMQLLSLMDQRLVSGSSFKVGPNNFLDRQFSPCNHHPRLNKNDNPFVSSSSFFAQSSHNTDFPALLNGARYSGDSSRKSLSHGQMLQHKGNSKVIGSAAPSNLVIQQPLRSDLKLEVCTLNRNPADFSIPDAKNEFTRSDKDLKPKKRNSSKERSRPANVEGPKRQKVRKESARKESSRV